MKTLSLLNQREIKLLNAALDELSEQVSQITGASFDKKEKQKRRFVFGSQISMLYKDLQFGYSINRDGILEFGIVAKMNKPCQNLDCLLAKLREVFGPDEDFEYEVLDMVNVCFKRFMNVDDQDFERMLNCVKEQLLERFILTYGLKPATAH